MQVASPSFRWAPAIPDAPEYNSYGRKSLYIAPGLGGRFFPRSGNHGVHADIEHKVDLQTSDYWCLFSPPDSCPRAKVDFAVWHAGYAYRYVVESPRRPDKRFWAFTPHASISAGWATNDPDAYGIPARSPLVGAQLGFDIDLHWNRFFFGWSIRYEALKQTRGPIGWSHFFAWNAIPVLQMGVDLGALQ